MDRFALDDLMREVLSMVKDKKDLDTSPYRRAMRDRANKMFPDPEHTQALELQGLRNTGATDVQTLGNTGGLAVQESSNVGALNVAKETNTGALARQGLINQGQATVADIHAGAQKYGADRAFEGSKIGLEGTKYAADMGRQNVETAGQTARDVATIGLGKRDPRSELFKTWSESMNPTPESLEVLRKGFDTIYPAPKPSRVPGKDFFKQDTVAPAPAVIPPVTPARATLAVPPPAEPSESLADKLRKKKLWFGEPVTPVQPTNRAKRSMRDASLPWEQR